jgi:hypothetical protein
MTLWCGIGAGSRGGADAFIACPDTSVGMRIAAGIDTGLRSSCLFQRCGRSGRSACSRVGSGRRGAPGLCLNLEGFRVPDVEQEENALLHASNASSSNTSDTTSTRLPLLARISSKCGAAWDKVSNKVRT